MTTKEKEQIAGKALYELKEAKETLAAFKCESDKLQKAFKAACDLLSEEKTGSRTDCGFAVHTSPHSMIAKYEAEWPSLDDLFKVVEGIKDTRKKIESFEKRLRDLGFPIT